MPGGHPDPQGTLKSLLAPGIFLCGFSCHNFSSLRLFFSVGMLATYPKINYFSFDPSQANFVHIHHNRTLSGGMYYCCV